MTEYAEALPYWSDWKASVYTWVIQICDALAGPPPVMIHTSTNEFRLPTNSRMAVTMMTLRSCGTVCRPARSMIIANGNSFQTLATISDGMTRLVESRKLMGDSMMYQSY